MTPTTKQRPKPQAKAGAPVDKSPWRVHSTSWWSFRFHSSTALLILIALGLSAAVAVFAMTIGDVPLAAKDVLTALWSQADAKTEFVVFRLRLPRLLLGFLVGMALAMSGAIFQGVTRNDLVAPDIIGVTSGAGAAGFIWILITHNVAFLPVVVFIGAVATTMAVYFLAKRGNLDPARLVLVGIGMQTLLGAAEAYMVRRFPIQDVVWADNLLIGSLSRASWSDVSLIALGLVVALPIALARINALRLIALGEDVAATSGIHVERTRLVLICVGCWLAAIAVSVAGLIGFVALVVPHIVRLMVGQITALSLLLTGIVGGLLTIIADVVGAHFMPVPVPVSVVIAAIGAPYFLIVFTLFQRRR
ncbi:FecCD family ABC transporter permease [Corynebacterium pseudopelargi]|uniref:Putative siderophore transport system permease protein YfhA n=1 Tax=Corynebacterium pseudopelargi TaxID=2080757 RepID=A0A3G6IW57_9CORY|nr:iron ABC transporter permease [Corynebacterium pseudopelargi]AZA09896.1 putative siderophore transport system permease protein YfhA [Corynebacterium pseudopelargi]